MNGLGGVKRVVVIGLGMTGLSVVHHLVRQSVAYDLDLEIKVIDTRATPPGQESLPSSVELCRGEWNMTWLLAADMIVASLALHWQPQSFSRLLKRVLRLWAILSYLLAL